MDPFSSKRSRLVPSHRCVTPGCCFNALNRPFIPSKQGARFSPHLGWLCPGCGEKLQEVSLKQQKSA